MNRKLKKDLQEFFELYLSFELSNQKFNGHSCILGRLDVIDDEGIFWKSFKLSILIDEDSYPYTVPQVYVKDEEIRRDQDWHIDRNGLCCLDIPHKLILMKNRRINISRFFKEVIYPFFSNYCYKEKVGKYANGEYDHDAKGIIQFYREEFGITDPQNAVQILNISLDSTNKMRRNDHCPICRSQKIKKCCWRTIKDLQRIDRKQLISDHEMFSSLAKQK